MKKFRFILPTVLLIALFSVSNASAFEKTADGVMAQYRDPNGRTLIVSRTGDINDYPENSAEAIQSAFEKGADMVLVDVRLSSDGKAVLFKDETLERMSADGSEKAVSDMTASELASVRLRNREGGSANEATDMNVPLLDDVLARFPDSVFILKTDTVYADEVFEQVKESGKTDSVIFLLNGASPKDTGSWSSALGETVETMTYFKGNVIFAATSHISSAKANGSDAVWLATSNPYGVVFGKTVMKKTAGNIRTMADTAEAPLCGKIRQDNEIWWDDLIGRGYNMILTDNVADLRLHIENADRERKELERLKTELIDGFTLPNFKAASYIDYKKAYNDAVKETSRLLSDGSTGVDELIAAQSSLRDAYDGIINNYDELAAGTAGVTMSPARITVAVLVIIGVAAGETFIYRKIKKPEKKSK